jgi:hypothetical protein
VRVSAPVGATMEFLAAEAPKARPRVTATRDMVDMLKAGKDRLLRVSSLLISSAARPYIRNLTGFENAAMTLRGPGEPSGSWFL